MRSPKWIAALALALLVAGVFAWLGRWQMSHAITVDDFDPTLSETVRPIAEVAEPGTPVTDVAAGMVLSARGAFVPGDFLVVEQRTNGGSVGAWAVGHFVVDAGELGNAADVADAAGHLSVAIGWTPTAAEAQHAIDAFADNQALVAAQYEIVGRYMPSDAPVVPKPEEDPARIASMAPAQLINLWAPFDGPAYGGYLVLHPADPLSDATLSSLGLTAIDSVAPLPVETINWLNLFYAIEWVVFAGFAIFFWYRLTRDDWEKQHELRLLSEGAGAGTSRPTE